MLHAKDCKFIQVPINPDHADLVTQAADKNNRSVRQWIRHLVEEKLALLGYIEEPVD